MASSATAWRPLLFPPSSRSPGQDQSRPLPVPSQALPRPPTRALSAPTGLSLQIPGSAHRPAISKLSAVLSGTAWSQQLPWRGIWTTGRESGVAAEQRGWRGARRVPAGPAFDLRTCPLRGAQAEPGGSCRRPACCLDGPSNSTPSPPWLCPRLTLVPFGVPVPRACQPKPALRPAALHARSTLGTSLWTWSFRLRPE